MYCAVTKTENMESTRQGKKGTFGTTGAGENVKYIIGKDIFAKEICYDFFFPV